MNEPKHSGEIFYDGIVSGEVKGRWLLSYLMERGMMAEVAVFQTREAALGMAAQLDVLTGVDHHWRLDTVFDDPSDAEDLAAMLGLDEADVDPDVNPPEPADVDPDEAEDDNDEFDAGWCAGAATLFLDLAHDVQRAAALHDLARHAAFPDIIHRLRIYVNDDKGLDAEIAVQIERAGGVVDDRRHDCMIAVFPCQAAAETLVLVANHLGITTTMCPDDIDHDFQAESDYDAGWRLGSSDLLHEIVHDKMRAQALLDYAVAANG
jgi:hypothetical protein